MHSRWAHLPVSGFNNIHMFRLTGHRIRRLHLGAPSCQCQCHCGLPSCGSHLASRVLSASLRQSRTRSAILCMCMCMRLAFGTMIKSRWTQTSIRARMRIRIRRRRSRRDVRVRTSDCDSRGRCTCRIQMASKLGEPSTMHAAAQCRRGEGSRSSEFRRSTCVYVTQYSWQGTTSNSFIHPME